MIVVPFQKQHFRDMVVQQRQQWFNDLLTEEILDSMEKLESYTALDGEEVLACSGVIEISPGRGLAWAYLSENVGSRLLFVTRAVKRFLRASQYRRIEIDVDCDFVNAHKWAKILGFELECERRRSFAPDGRDCALYALVRG